MPPKNKSLQSLQKTWYKKLKDSGFEDIEQDPTRLKKWTVTKVNSMLYRDSNEDYDTSVSLERLADRQNYYRLAGHFLHDYKFETETDKLIWLMHSEGISHRDISEALKKKRVRKARTQVLSIIQHLKKEMLKLYANRSSE